MDVHLQGSQLAHTCAAVADNKLSNPAKRLCARAWLRRESINSPQARVGRAHAAKLRRQHDLVLVGVPAIQRGRRRVAGRPEAQAAAAASPAAAAKADACASAAGGAKPSPGVRRRRRACAAEPRARRGRAEPRPGFCALRTSPKSSSASPDLCRPRQCGHVLESEALLGYQGVP